MNLFTRGIDQLLRIGDDIVVGPTDIDAKAVRLLARGRTLGGPDDGGTFESTYELRRGQSAWIGPMIQVAVVEILDDVVRLGVNCPPHLPVERKEVADKMRREHDHGGGGVE
jgi:sRNA-binding carbon storage regulator CsrA